MILLMEIILVCLPVESVVDLLSAVGSYKMVPQSLLPVRCSIVDTRYPPLNSCHRQEPRGRHQLQSANSSAMSSNHTGSICSNSYNEATAELDPIVADYDKPPPPPPEYTWSDPSCQGILGLTLKEALDELRTENSTEKGGDCHYCNDGSSNDNDNDAYRSDMAALFSNPAMIQQIQRSLGEALQSPILDAPAALMRGRIDHYNRHNTKWRWAVDDVEFRPRHALTDRNRPKKTQRSLWDLLEDEDTNDSSQSRKRPKLNLEILAYNDLE